MNNSYVKHLRSAKPKINTSQTKYPVIPMVVETQLKWKIHNEQGWTLMWNDHAITMQFLRSLSTTQKINHFPGMHELSRKNRLAKNLNAMRKQYPQVYNFYPQTWILPFNYNDLAAFNEVYPERALIVKPEAGCQGKGIFLTNSVTELENKSGLIVQEYIENPCLLEGLKFDFRIYVLVTCMNPLRIYVFDEGLVRLATQQFQKPNKDNLRNTFSHLTNYAINKDSSKFKSFDSDFATGHKRSLKATLTQFNSPTLLDQIHSVIIKTLISAQPQIANQYRLAQPHNNDLCFQLLGFDIILTSQLKPFLLEVNHTPSFNIDTELDRHVKKKLIEDTLRMVHPREQEFQEEAGRKKYQETNNDRMKVKDWREGSNKGGFTRIYPCETLQDTERYDEYFKHSQVVYHKKYGTNIVRSQKRVYKQQQQHAFVPRLNAQKDLYKVYNTASNIKALWRTTKLQKIEQRKDTGMGRYGDIQGPPEQKKTYTNYKQITSIYGKKELTNIGHKVSHSANHFK